MVKGALAVVAGVLSALVLYGAVTTLQPQQLVAPATREETTAATKTITATKAEGFTVMKAETEAEEEKPTTPARPGETRTEAKAQKEIEEEKITPAVDYTPAAIAFLSFLVALGIYTAARGRVYG